MRKLLRFSPLFFLLCFQSCFLRDCRTSKEGPGIFSSTATGPGIVTSTPLPGPPSGGPVNSSQALGPLPADVEQAALESVLPGSSTTFDPFTYGRPGSPYGPGKLFSPGIGSARCGPMELPMSSQFADPGDTQAVIIIAGNGLECIADIDHDKPGAAISFTVVAGIFTNPPWRIVLLTPSTVTITNGSVTLRFTYRITPAVTFISQVEYL